MHVYNCMGHRPCCTKLYSVRKFSNARVRNFYSYENVCDYSTLSNLQEQLQMLGRGCHAGPVIVGEAQWPIGYGVGLRIKRSSVRIRPWPLRWVLGQGSLLPLSQGEAFTLASISYLAILVKYILAKKKLLGTKRNRWPRLNCCNHVYRLVSSLAVARLYHAKCHNMISHLLVDEIALTCNMIRTEPGRIRPVIERKYVGSERERRLWI